MTFPAGSAQPLAAADHPAAWPASRLLADCSVKRTRRSGPGGQHRNKVETAVVITHEPSGTTAEASERRSQSENQTVAVFRLRINLALALRSETLLPAASELWQSRCRGGKIAINEEHDDFPSLLAEALDQVAGHGWDVRAAAVSLSATPSQLVKLLEKEPRALLLVNRERQKLGLHLLK